MIQPIDFDFLYGCSNETETKQMYLRKQYRHLRKAPKVVRGSFETHLIGFEFNVQGFLHQS